ncbi:MAG: tryptophan 7-halogenase [Verrucomicrobia bacterium]|nr:tryptophan 7-halogenase [Verrucomicrobiota bacterium]
MPLPEQPAAPRYDVAIIGGALAGAATALLLLRRQPTLRILILEKSPAFTRRVGEATVEVSGYFLGRVLGLTQHLNDAHLVKQGMRFWFANGQAKSLADCSEIGGRYQVRLPAWQVDRAVLDEEVLRRTVAAGADLWRPASVSHVQLTTGGEQTVTVRRLDRTETVSARWVVDASGVAALLARQEGWLRPNEAHPTTAVWARWTGVKDWDGPELAHKHPAWARACRGTRGTATNHLVGDGWWAWFIPLKGGDVSIGVVFDERLVQWPAGGSLGQRLKDFLVQHPVGRELLAEAQWKEGDVHWRRHLTYASAVHAGDGFVLVGDASAFLDPLYSPGMDWVAYTTTRAADLICAQEDGGEVGRLIARHNRDFTLSYERWFEALYRDKYEYLGEFDLMRLAFKLDLRLYYLGVVTQPFKRGAAAFRDPVFCTPPSTPVFYFMRGYNRRLAAIARARRARGALGRKNAGCRHLFPGFTLEPGSALGLVRSLLGWGWLELTEGWRSWLPAGRTPDATWEAAPACAGAAVESEA